MSTTTKEAGGAEIVTLPTTPALYFGAGTGLLGLLANGTRSTLQGKRVVFHTVFGGINWFLFGTLFWFTRSTIKSQLSLNSQTAFRQDLLCSTSAGTVAGLVAGALRGRAHILPASVIWTTVGFTGQVAASGVARVADRPGDSRPILEILADKPWWPLKRLSDAEYEEETREQLIAVEAEIALIDEKIESLHRTGVASPTKGRGVLPPRE